MRLKIAQQKVGTMLPDYIYDLGDIQGCEEKEPYYLGITTRASSEEVMKLVIASWPQNKKDVYYLIRMDEDEVIKYHFGILEEVVVEPSIDREGRVVVTVKFWSPSVLNGFSEEDKKWVFI